MPSETSLAAARRHGNARDRLAYRSPSQTSQPDGAASLEFKDAPSLCSRILPPTPDPWILVRILIVSNLYPPHYIGGYELYCRDRAEYLMRQGHDVRVLTSSFSLPNVSSPASEAGTVFQKLWVDVPSLAHPRKIGSSVGARRTAHNLAVLDDHLASQSPDVVCWWNLSGISSLLIKRAQLARVPGVAVICSDWPIHVPRATAGWRRLARRVRVASFLERHGSVAVDVDLSGSTSWLFVVTRCVAASKVPA